MYYMQSVINSVKTVLGSHVNIHGCFYHLTQSTRQKIQKLGLSTVYRDDDDVKHWCGMLDALAFLPLADVAEGMSYTRANMPMGDGLESLADLILRRDLRQWISQACGASGMQSQNSADASSSKATVVCAGHLECSRHHIGRKRPQQQHL